MNESRLSSEPVGWIFTDPDRLDLADSEAVRAFCAAHFDDRVGLVAGPLWMPKRLPGSEVAAVLAASAPAQPGRYSLVPARPAALRVPRPW